MKLKNSPSPDPPNRDPQPGRLCLQAGLVIFLFFFGCTGQPTEPGPTGPQMEDLGTIENRRIMDRFYFEPDSLRYPPIDPDTSNIKLMD